MTSIPAEPGFVMIILLFDDDGIAGFAEHPVIAWRTEGKRLVPITEHGDVEEEMKEDRYALRNPDDSYDFPTASTATTPMPRSPASRNGSWANPAHG